MGDSAIFRALVTPVVLIVVFFAFARACANTIKKTRAEEFAAANPDAAPSSAAVRTPAAKEQKKFGEIEYPPGLTAEQIAYHVTVNSEFAEPLTASAGKNGYGDGFEALQRARYIEMDENQQWRLSRDGIMKLRVVQETTEGWTFEISKRVFDKVTAIKVQPDGNALVTIAWHWEENDLAKALRIRDQKLGAVAEFRNNDNAWTLFKWNSSLRSGY